MPIDKMLLNKLTQNDPTITEINLSQQNLTDQDFENLCHALKANNHVIKLDLSHNKITTLQPLSQLALESLKAIDFKHNRITIIMGLDRLVNLQTLELSENQITTIAGLDKLVNLQALVLIRNQITTIVGLDRLVNLQTLNLSFNNITAIEGLDKLVNLQTLELIGNQITTIAGLDKLVNLQALVLIKNQITTIAGLDRLINLQTLYLTSNQITILGGLDRLVNLQTLSLYDNRITAIMGLDRLVNLQMLNLRFNKITIIEGLDKLVNLQTLDLSENQITTIAGLDRLINLQTLELKSNPVKANSESILKILQQKRAEITEVATFSTQINHPDRYDTSFIPYDWQNPFVDPFEWQGSFSASVPANVNNIATPANPPREEKQFPMPLAIPSLKNSEQNYQQGIILTPEYVASIVSTKQQLEEQIESNKKLEQQLQQQLKILEAQPKPSQNQLQSLQSQLIQLHQKQEDLEANYAKNIQTQAAAEIYKERPNLWLHYHVISIQFEEIIIGAKSASSNLIDTSHTGALGDAGNFINKLGKILARIPAIGNTLESPFAVFNYFLSSIDQTRQTNILKYISSLGTLPELQEVIAKTARLITDCYEEQLLALYTEEEEQQQTLIATSTVGKIKARGQTFVQNVRETVLKESAASTVEKLANFAVMQILSALLDMSINPKSRQSLEQQFLFAIARPPSATEEVKQIILSKFGFFSVATRDGRNWQFYAIYCKPGIRTANGKCYAGGETDPDLYGFRLGTDEEASELNLYEVSGPKKKVLSVASKVTTVSAIKVENSPTQTAISYRTIQAQLQVQASVAVVPADKNEVEELKRRLEEQRLAHEKQMQQLKEQQEAEKREREMKDSKRDELIEKLMQKEKQGYNDNDVIVGGGRQVQVTQQRTTQNQRNNRYVPTTDELVSEQTHFKGRLEVVEGQLAQISEALDKPSPRNPYQSANEKERKELGLGSSRSELFKKESKHVDTEASPLIPKKVQQQELDAEQEQSKGCQCAIL